MLKAFHPKKQIKGNHPTTKTVFIGDQKSDKTKLLFTVSQNSYPKEYIPTVFDNYVYTSATNDKHKTALWDTAGDENYQKLRPLSYPETNVFVIVYSIEHPETLFETLNTYIPEISFHVKHPRFILVGNNCEVRDEKKSTISVEDAEFLAREIGAHGYLECSPKGLKGLKELMDFAIEVGLGMYDEKTSKELTNFQKYLNYKEKFLEITSVDENKKKLVVEAQKLLKNKFKLVKELSLLLTKQQEKVYGFLVTKLLEDISKFDVKYGKITGNVELECVVEVQHSEIKSLKDEVKLLRDELESEKKSRKELEEKFDAFVKKLETQGK